MFLSLILAVFLVSMISLLGMFNFVLLPTAILEGVIYWTLALFSRPVVILGFRK